MRTLIINGTVVNADGQYRQDVLIENGLISQVAPDIAPETDDRIIDAQGCYVFPGGIDVHTHFNIDV
ncbi:dihydropyrimidinase, partial [Klebsiella pneumoniae]|nr:dihydropyrimidinase [Klebsiella pneumoniae]